MSEQFFYHGTLAERRLERVTLSQFAQHVPHIPRAQSVGSARDSASVDACVYVSKFIWLAATRDEFGCSWGGWVSVSYIRHGHATIAGAVALAPHSPCRLLLDTCSFRRATKAPLVASRRV